MRAMFIIDKGSPGVSLGTEEKKTGTKGSSGRDPAWSARTEGLPDVVAAAGARFVRPGGCRVGGLGHGEPEEAAAAG